MNDSLEHFGTKGMKWGHRKVYRDFNGTPMSKPDVKWAKTKLKDRTGIEAYNDAAKRMNEFHIKRINNKPEYVKAIANKQFLRDTPVRRKYYKEYEQTFNREFNAALKNRIGDSPSGKYSIVSASNIEGGMMPAWQVVVRPSTAAHSELQHEDPTIIPIKVIFKDGVIVSFEMPQMDMMQSEEIVDNFLEHYGKLGMKWGRRKAAAPTATNSQPGASQDAKHVTAIKRKVDKGGTAALSNRELKDLTTRMNLEKQYAALKPTPAYKKVAAFGAKKSFDILVNVGSQHATHLVNKGVNKGIAKAIAAYGAQKAVQGVTGGKAQVPFDKIWVK